MILFVVSDGYARVYAELYFDRARKYSKRQFAQASVSDKNALAAPVKFQKTRRFEKTRSRLSRSCSLYSRPLPGE